MKDAGDSNGHAIPNIAPLYSLVGARTRMQLSLKPTPIHHLHQLSSALGCSIYCKRDDLNGFGFGGNKIRKLEYLLKQAVDDGARAIVTCGSNQSNWCRMTAVAGAAANLDVHLVLGGSTPKTLSGNLLVSNIVGATLHHVDTDSDSVLENAAAELAAELASDDYKVAQIIMGGSNGLGTLGYVDAYREILEYSARHRKHFHTIVTATGSGGTQAGLIAATHLASSPSRVIGIAVSRCERSQSNRIRQVLRQFDQVLGVATDSAEIHVDDSYIGLGYRRPTADCERAIELFAKTEGIFLDRVYTGKAAAGLIDYAKNGKFRPSENILFVHTGGNVQLFE